MGSHDAHERYVHLYESYRELGESYRQQMRDFAESLEGIISTLQSFSFTATDSDGNQVDLPDDDYYRGLNDGAQKLADEMTKILRRGIDRWKLVELDAEFDNEQDVEFDD